MAILLCFDSSHGTFVGAGRSQAAGDDYFTFFIMQITARMDNPPYYSISGYLPDMPILYHTCQIMSSGFAKNSAIEKHAAL